MDPENTTIESDDPNLLIRTLSSLVEAAELDPDDKTVIPRVLAVITIIMMKSAMLSQYNHLKRIPIMTALENGPQRVQRMRNHASKAPMRAALGLAPSTFTVLLEELEKYGGLGPSRYVDTDEKLAHFLYVCREGLGTPHAGETFQRSKDTISKSFHSVLAAFSAPEFYNRHVKQPTADTPISPEIKGNPRFSPFLDRCIGAIDGTLIPVTPPADMRIPFRSRKGSICINVLAACDFELHFTYVYAGWEGSAPDTTVMQHAVREKDLVIPEGRRYLADRGFPYITGLLVPFRGVRYHLNEWKRSQQRPQDAKELYNLRHACARNVIERIFGVIKERWKILARGSEWPLQDQIALVPALCALHNLVRDHEYAVLNLKNAIIDDGLELYEIPKDEKEQTEAQHVQDMAALEEDRALSGPTSRTAGSYANAVRYQKDIHTKIAQDMWEQYRSVR